MRLLHASRRICRRLRHRTLARHSTTITTVHKCSAPPGNRRVAVLDGSMNPPTVCHQEMVRTACAGHLACTEVLVLLSLDNADKGRLSAVEAQTRIGMIRAMVQQDLPEVPCSIGTVSNAPRFVDKADALRKLYATDGKPSTIMLLLGSDTVQRLLDPAYYNNDVEAQDMALERLFQCEGSCRIELGCLTRPPSPNTSGLATTQLRQLIQSPQLSQYEERVHFVEDWFLEAADSESSRMQRCMWEGADPSRGLSSSQARKDFSEGKSSLCVSPAVQAYIRGKGLYGSNPSGNDTTDGLAESVGSLSDSWRAKSKDDLLVDSLVNTEETFIEGPSSDDTDEQD